MTPRRFRTLIEGAVAAWTAPVTLAFDEDTAVCRISRDDESFVTVNVEMAPFGVVWRIAAPGQRARVHASVVPALRGLRTILCPERGGGRVLFVSET